MYQEQHHHQHQPYVPSYPSYPNPIPLPPASDSFTYRHHGIGNYGVMASMTSAGMHPIGNFGVVTPPMTISQPLQCEVCNITCHTADVLATHKLGKKHSKNLQKQAITSVIAQNMPPFTPASAPSVGKLEKMHRILQNGASVDTLLHCDLCDVTCNNEYAFQSHVASKKHVAKAIMQKACKPQPSSAGVFECELCKISCTSNELLNMHISGKKHQKNLKDSVQVRDPIMGTTIISHEVKPISCEICGISCDTNEMLIIHFTGKKHQKNLEKSQKATVPHNRVPTSKPEAISTVVEPAATPTVIGHVSTPTVVEPALTPTVVEPALTPTVVEPAPTPTVVEPAPTPRVVESAPTPMVVGPAPTPTVVEPALALTVVEPARVPTVVEPASTPTVVEPASTPTVVEPVASPTWVEPVLTPTVVEPALTPTVVEPAPTPRVVEPAPIPTVVGPAPTPTVVEPALALTVVEPARAQTVVEPARAQTVVEPASTTTVVEPASTPTVVEPVASPTWVEPVLTPTVVEVLQDSVKKDDKIVVSHKVKLKCEVCNISCDTNEMLKIHSTGRKHQNNLKNLDNPSVFHKHVPTTHDGGEIASLMVVDQLQGSLKDDKIVNEDGSIRKGKRAGSQLDLESKKQKIMQVGTAPTSLRACTVCNVVCNSPKVFDYHIAGQKHAAMVAKQAQAQ